MAGFEFCYAVEDDFRGLPWSERVALEVALRVLARGGTLAKAVFCAAHDADIPEEAVRGVLSRYRNGRRWKGS